MLHSSLLILNKETGIHPSAAMLLPCVYHFYVGICSGSKQSIPIRPLLEDSQKKEKKIDSYHLSQLPNFDGKVRGGVFLCCFEDQKIRSTQKKIGLNSVRFCYHRDENGEVKIEWRMWRVKVVCGGLSAGGDGAGAGSTIRVKGK